MNKLQTIATLSCIFSLLSLLHSPLSLAAKNINIQKPKLILQITVDQLRGDLPFRYQDRFVDNGFNYFINQGTVYRDAHHAHANTETIVGHATLATGAYPSEHGLVGNIWYDRSINNTVYNIEDADYYLLSKDADVDKSTEIDPTQKAANVDGRSPNTISVSTFSDELLIATAGQAKVFGVSIKDRGAVSMAGHGGKALWFSKATQEFVSSNYYYDQYPQWVNDWNAKQLPSSYKNTKWNLLNNRETYSLKDKDDNEWEMDLAGYSKTFPHPLGESKYFSTLLTLNPLGDELTVDFAKSLIINENIGKDEITDYLSISLSSTDYIGHFFGVSSLEMEDNLLRLDRTLADLFNFIDKEIGLENTVIVLASDHGSPEAPGYLAEQNLQGKYVTKKQWDESVPVAKVKKSLGIKEPLIKGYYHPYIYLDLDVIAKHKLELADVQNKIADALTSVEDVYATIASNKIVSGQLADTRINRLVSNNYYPGRSGDIYIVFKPQEFINDMDGLKVASTHGSPWTYDTFVPVMLAGKNIPAQHIYRPVETVDLSTTLSAILNIKSPSASQGKILKEIFN
ncbi:alkaline phosphatase family protein [Moritella sp. Urea-trap-13]|uniref:alkaline phosphatase family protein n=1 Tax=Moritella sp. Urea-trap-13 TaxID=2058327 RepID=UPI000C342C46|nr:alkaline phosphatase family protein [Moritella sp. Urea-trap-13]PKH06114.1 alkaline phosphatase [Moritella sp. Urea-trap-13]